MKHIKNFKIFENTEDSQTLRDLIGNVKKEITETLIETDKGIIVNGLTAQELNQYELDELITIEDEIVYRKGDNYEFCCLAMDENGKILAMSTIPGDYLGCEIRGGKFKVIGHDGIEIVNLKLINTKFLDRKTFK
jgi:hypothetical protein